ncbi:MAG: hypothetical protein WC604_00415 [Candidatus Gracilibacteria bacterium]
MAEIQKEEPNLSPDRFEVSFAEPIVISGDAESGDADALNGLVESINYMRTGLQKWMNEKPLEPIEKPKEGMRITGCVVQRYDKHIGVTPIIEEQIRRELWCLNIGEKDDRLYPCKRSNKGEGMFFADAKGDSVLRKIMKEVVKDPRWRVVASRPLVLAMELG